MTTKNLSQMSTHEIEQRLKIERDPAMREGLLRQHYANEMQRPSERLLWRPLRNQGFYSEVVL